MQRGWLFLFIASSIVASCSVTSPPAQSGGTMNGIPNVYEVSGRLTSTSSYCGGMAPSPETEARHHTPRPRRTWLYVREGKRNNENAQIIDSLLTDTSGMFNFFLPPGNYIILLPNQRDKKILDQVKKSQNQYVAVDELCLSRWWESGLFQITVEDSAILDLNYNFHSRCFVPYEISCVSYHGPYPP